MRLSLSCSLSLFPFPNPIRPDSSHTPYYRGSVGVFHFHTTVFHTDVFHTPVHTHPSKRIRPDASLHTPLRPRRSIHHRSRPHHRSCPQFPSAVSTRTTPTTAATTTTTTNLRVPPKPTPHRVGEDQIAHRAANVHHHDRRRPLHPRRAVAAGALRGGNDGPRQDKEARRERGG